MYINKYVLIVLSIVLTGSLAFALVQYFRSNVQIKNQDPAVGRNIGTSDQDIMWYPTTTYIQPTSILLSKNPTELPKILSIDQVDEQVHEIGIANLTTSAWLCVQADFYSKPSYLECNSGAAISEVPYMWYGEMGKDTTVMKLYSDPSMSVLYDQVVATKATGNDYKLSALSRLCGTLTQDSSGAFFAEGRRILTVPGWMDLLPYVNSSVCLEGESYDNTDTFRVYFISETDPK